ncbi:phosphatidylinositol 3,4,5-trisphosphate 3-phosphatase and dual-specificity protein phosphatase pten [Plakobranchus ocellatus]|uniref:Phosphatidylinositol 3,4,5-trisphosphate 3-phosphatase and dual-specificity protein phosphatase pten n=1 Tax=Plakobranchus ocellatus TaxID=259542 RepID=A0AAV4ABX5_9GAST|nr:phosphatidylinositol 3,4,5-trisphosphate 3-phosphatase and dual-specificity protein phosphatase pten [Plakobranchus ocellatus]
MFHFWFNTFFVRDREHQNQNGAAHSFHSGNYEHNEILSLTLCKSELDRANKDKAHRFFSPNFRVRVYFSVMHDSGSSTLERSRSADDMTGGDRSFPFHYHPVMQLPGKPGPPPHIQTSPNLLHPVKSGSSRGGWSSPSSPVAPQLPVSSLTPPLPSATSSKHKHSSGPSGRTCIDKYSLLASDSHHPHSPHHKSPTQLPSSSTSSQQLPPQHHHSQVMFYGGCNSDVDSDHQDNLSDTDLDEWSDCDITQV